MNMNLATEPLTLFAQWTSENNTDDIEKMLVIESPDRFKSTNLQAVASSNRLHSKKRMIATLLHIKKSTKKEISFKDAKTKLGKTSTYHRFLVLADEDLETFGIIIKQNNVAKFVFAHHVEFGIGDKVVISRPKFEGHFQTLKLVHTDCIYPISNVPMSPIKNIASGSAHNKNYACYHLETTKLEVEEVVFASEACNGPCDGRYLSNCYCAKRMQTSSWIVGVKTVFTSKNNELEFKSYYSHELTSKLVSQSIIDRKGKSVGSNSLTWEIEEHIKKQLTGKKLNVIVWFKPFQKEGEEDATPSSGNISKMDPASGTTLVVFKDPEIPANVDNLDDDIDPDYVNGSTRAASEKQKQAPKKKESDAKKAKLTA